MRKRKKIFRPKRRYKIKRRNTNALKVVGGVAAVAVLVFVGYSAAGPVSRFFEERASHAEVDPWEPSPEVTDAAQDMTVSMPAGDDPIAYVNDPAVSKNIPAEVTPADTAIAPDPENLPSTLLQTANSEGAAENTAAVTETAAPVFTPELRSGGAAYTVSAEDMTDLETLTAALDQIKTDGCSAVILPMKIEGGFFCYNTGIPLVSTVTDGEYPVRSELSAETIANAAMERGLRPIALISVLKDNNRYGDYRDGAYHSLDDDTWLDTSPDKGGKPWISPFDDTAREYLCDIVKELGNAGFKEIIADDFIFPEFRSSDIDMLGDHVAPYSDRYQALTSLAVMMTEAGNETGAEVMLRITANSVIKGYSELFHPYDLAGCHIAIDYSENNIARTMIASDEEIILDDLGERDKVTAVFAEVTTQCGDMDTVPMIERDSMSAEDYNEAVAALTAIGYGKYYVY